jgi:hypothetical protein
MKFGHASSVKAGLVILPAVIDVNFNLTMGHGLSAIEVRYSVIVFSRDLKPLNGKGRSQDGYTSA